MDKNDIDFLFNGVDGEADEEIEREISQIEAECEALERGELIGDLAEIETINQEIAELVHKAFKRRK